MTAALPRAAALALALAAHAALAVLAPSAPATIIVCVAPADSVVAAGDSVVVRVLTDGPATDLQGFVVRLTYAPSVLGPSLATAAGSVLDLVPAVFFPYDSPPDTLGFDAAILGTTTGGPGTLGTFTFVPQTTGTCALHLTLALLRNSLNDPLAVTVRDGELRVVDPTAAATRSWGAIKALFTAGPAN